MLDLFNINQNYAANEFIYDKFHKKIKKKILILIDQFKNKKIFLEKNISKSNNSKIVKNYTNLLHTKFF